MPSINFKLTNLNCNACGKVSKMKIEDIPGVKNVEINQNGKAAAGTLEADREISIQEIQAALAGTQYKAEAN